MCIRCFSQLNIHRDKPQAAVRRKLEREGRVGVVCESGLGRLVFIDIACSNAVGKLAFMALKV